MSTCMEAALAQAQWIFFLLALVLSIYVKIHRKLTVRETLLIMVGLRRVFYSVPELMLFACAIGLPLIMTIVSLEQCKDGAMANMSDLPVLRATTD